MRLLIYCSYLLCLGSAFLLPSCSGDAPAEEKKPELPAFTLLSDAETGISFENKIVETPVRCLSVYDYFYNGGGVAVGDLNGDELPDLFFCGNDTDNKLYFNQGNWQFEDVTAQAGISSEGKWSTGVSLVDINEDGWMDIYVSNSGPTNQHEKLANQLYVNNKNGTFSEQAAAYGINDGGRTTQSAFFDMDRDGDLDLFVMNHSLRNMEGDGIRWHRKFSELKPEEQKRQINSLYRNNGNGSFTDISEQAGISKVGFGLGLAISDFDENGYLDVFVANDYFIPDFFYLNNGDGTFTDRIKSKNSHVSFYSMGCDAADINNDGLTDLAVVDMTPADHFRNKTLMASMNVAQFTWLNEVMGYAPQYMFNTLQLNRGYGIFSEIALMAGTAQTDWSWSALLADFDNDGLKDYLVTNGYWRDTKDNDWRIGLKEHYKKVGKSKEAYFEHLQKANSQPIPNYMFRNDGNLKFTDVSEDWGLDQPSFSHGAAYADLDQDGDLDLVTNNLGSKAFVYRNNSRERSAANFVRFQLKAGDSYSRCLHSQIKIYYGDSQQQMVEYSFTRGYQSQVEPIAHFGLGEVEQIDRAEILWPDGTATTLESPDINQTHKVDMNEADRRPAAPSETDPYFVDITKQQQAMNFRHRENEYDDFATEVLLPHRQSRLGPGLAVGDINGDGLEDFYVGGAKGQSGALYTQLPSMAFRPVAQPAISADAEQEDLGALFFDADQDGDLDLYVASGGGGAFREGSSSLQDRLYLNDGNGNLSKAGNKLPKIISSTAAVAAADWDQDGDLDLFVGGRTVPGKYPHAPRSYLLRNDGGKFTDITSEVPSLQRIGMVTGASWTDTDGDNWKDLLLVGEWMPITLLKNEQGKLSNANALEEKGMRGWWYQIAPGDFDGDGDQDFIVGNIGLNNKFHPSEKKNLHVFCNDFDDNGTPDIVLSKHYKGDIVPVRGKECSTTQMPFLAEKFESYAKFASSSLEEIYGEEKLSAALHYKVDNFASVYMENTGDGKFELTELPIAAQIAPINSIVTKDFNGDGHLDAVIGGNMFETEVETPAYDGGKGLLLLGNGDGSFHSSLYMPDSGLFLHKNVKDIELIRLGAEGRSALVVANNDGPIEMFVRTKQTSKPRQAMQ